MKKNEILEEIVHNTYQLRMLKGCGNNGNT